MIILCKFFTQIYFKNVQIKLKCLILVTDLSSLHACVHFYDSVMTTNKKFHLEIYRFIFNDMLDKTVGVQSLELINLSCLTSGLCT